MSESRASRDRLSLGVLTEVAGLAEAPISATALEHNVSAWPRASKIVIDLLSSIDLQDLERGLVEESLAYSVLQGSEEHSAWLAERPRPSAAGPGTVRITREDNVIEIMLGRPEARNAIDRDMRDSLRDAFTVAALDPDVRGIKLGGAGKAFCVGADLSEFGTTRDPAIAHDIRMQTLPALMIIRCRHKFEAHVQGACVGSGLEMAAFAARLTATSTSWFQLPELAMGLLPGAGGCVSVSRRIGRRRAAMMILSGRRIGARTALEWGLIDAIMDEPPASDGQADIRG